MRVLLDTTFLVDLLRRRPNALTLFAEMIATADEIATSVLSLAEVYAGQRKGEEFITAKLFSQLTLCPVTPSIAKRGGQLKNSAARKGRTLLLDDMMIAATALELGIPVLTDNIKDFKTTGVSLYGAPEN